MVAVRYEVPGATSSAFVPVPALDGRGLGPYAVKNYVVGQPGTQGIPAAPPEITAEWNGLPVWSGYSGGTRMMPDVWYPQLYYEPVLSETTNEVSIYSDNQMPIPAADPRGKAAVLARAPVFLGQSQLRTPRALPRWANWIPTPNYGG